MQQAAVGGSRSALGLGIRAIEQHLHVHEADCGGIGANPECERQQGHPGQLNNRNASRCAGGA